MNCNEYDIAVIGGGSIGSSIFARLSRTGLGSTVLIDKGRTSESATSKSAGMVRVFHESLEHMDLALANHRLLKKSVRTGSLYFFHKSRFESYSANLKKMEEANYPFEVLTDTQGKKRFPEFHWKKGDWAIYEPVAGHIDPQSFCEERITEGRTMGGKLLDQHEVKRICPYLDRYRICTGESAVTAKAVILAGGAGLIPRLSELGLSLPLEKRLLTTFVAKRNTEVLLPHYFDRETLEFGKLGDPDQVVLSSKRPTRIIDNHWREGLEERSAFDCYAPNRQGLMGEVPGLPRLILATGWGGTALKFSLAVGERVGTIMEKEICKRNQLYA